MVNQSINPKVYNESLRLIDWFNPPSEKLPHGDDFRVGPKVTEHRGTIQYVLPCEAEKLVSALIQGTESDLPSISWKHFVTLSSHSAMKKARLAGVKFSWWRR